MCHPWGRREDALALLSAVRLRSPPTACTQSLESTSPAAGHGWRTAGPGHASFLQQTPHPPCSLEPSVGNIIVLGHSCTVPLGTVHTPIRTRGSAVRSGAPPLHQAPRIPSPSSTRSAFFLLFLPASTLHLSALLLGSTLGSSSQRPQHQRRCSCQRCCD